MANSATDLSFRFPLLQRQHGLAQVQHPNEHFYQQGYLAGIAKAQQQAYDRGLQAGQQAAEALMAQQLQLAAEQAAARQAQALTLLSQQFNQQLQWRDEQLAQEIYLLVEQLATTVLAAELQLQPRLLQQAVATLVPELALTDALESIYISVQDAALFAGISQLAQIPLLTDPHLPSGVVQLNGQQQLYQLDFAKRLQQALQPLRQQLWPAGVTVTDD
jgi:flagellar biosynthesis/type III secretory pathway protein FliH